MNSLIKQSKVLPLWFKKSAPIITAIRHHWNKDFKPGPYPVTEQQRIEAAKKYGIPIEEYEAYPDDGTGSGDYPKLPLQSVDSKDPFYPWDSPELKRNFGETLHEDFDLVREDRYDVTRRLHQPLWILWVQTLGVLGLALGLQLIASKGKMFLAVSPRQYPQEGKVHYTFEQP